MQAKYGNEYELINNKMYLSFSAELADLCGIMDKTLAVGYVRAILTPIKLWLLVPVLSIVRAWVR